MTCGSDFWEFVNNMYPDLVPEFEVKFDDIIIEYDVGDDLTNEGVNLW